MIKVNRSPDAPSALAKGTYQANDVQEQLCKDFSDKCYLCECNAVTAKAEIEHLIPQKVDETKILDWNNLFLSCYNCNSIKKQNKYDKNIIDCCRDEPEKLLNQTFVVIKDKIEPFIEPIEASSAEKTAAAKKTAELLNDCFGNKKSYFREKALAEKVDKFREVMKILFDTLNDWNEKHNDDDLNALKGMLDRKHLFACFTRSYVRAHISDYPELEDDIKLD